MRTILLIMIGLSTFLSAEFTTAGQPNGVVKDTSTLLQWQDDYSSNAGNIKSATWTAAIDYCEDLGLAGGGWRLPNKKELLSLVDYTRFIPSIDVIFNHTTTSDYYWSSTTYAGDTDRAWYVGFYYGYTYHHAKSASHAVRCVRSGQ